MIFLNECILPTLLLDAPIVLVVQVNVLFRNKHTDTVLGGSFVNI